MLCKLQKKSTSFIWKVPYIIPRLKQPQQNLGQIAHNVTKKNRLDSQEISRAQCWDDVHNMWWVQVGCLYYMTDSEDIETHQAQA